MNVARVLPEWTHDQSGHVHNFVLGVLLVHGVSPCTNFLLLPLLSRMIILITGKHPAARD